MARWQSTHDDPYSCTLPSFGIVITYWWLVLPSLVLTASLSKLAEASFAAEPMAGLGQYINTHSLPTGHPSTVILIYCIYIFFPPPFIWFCFSFSLSTRKDRRKSKINTKTLVDLYRQDLTPIKIRENWSPLKDLTSPTSCPNSFREQPWRKLIFRWTEKFR